MVKTSPVAASRSILKRRASAGRGAGDLPLCIAEFPQDGLSGIGHSQRAQSIHGSSRRDQPRRVRCRYTLKLGPKAGLKCTRRPHSGDYCRQHQISVPPPQAELSPYANRSLRVSHRCQAPTLKGLNCSFKALPQAPYCKRHLTYVGNTERRSVLSRNKVSAFAPASPPRVSIPFEPSPQHGEELNLHQKRSSFAEEEALVPICRHCKIITLRNCNLCQSYGCRMRVLSVVHEATDLGHNRFITPHIEDNKPSTSNSQPCPRLRSNNGTQILTLSAILPKLKVCRPSDFGMPAAIPMGINFLVWDRWWHVKQSRLGFHAGKGLFTVHSIPKGQDLFPFIGPEYDTATFHEIARVLPEIRCHALLYWDQTNQPGREVWIDGGTRHSNLAGFIQSIHREKDCAKRANVYWELRENGNQGRPSNDVSNFIMTVSKRPIAAGEEIYTTCDGREKSI